MKGHATHIHHQHTHSPVLKNINRAFVIGIVLNFTFVILEVVTGLSVHALSLLSDAGHNLADVASLSLSLLAFRLLKIKSNKKFTYGYRKTSILVALFNAIVLLISISFIVVDALRQLSHPAILPGFTIATVAAVGILINATSALLFLRNKESDVNIKSAYLHLMSDALVSLGIVIGGVVIYYTKWYWIDPALGIVIALIILLGTFRLLKSTLRLSLDGVPEAINTTLITEKITEVRGVLNLHHLHIWAISTTENALTAHLVLAKEATNEQIFEIKNTIKHLLNHHNIQHITLETEHENNLCSEQKC